MYHYIKSTPIFLIALALLIVCPMTKLHAKNSEYIFNPKDAHHKLYIPDENTKSPAILMLHASTGIENVNLDWATRLKNKGYVVYIIDSFKPRGWEDRKAIGWEKATEAQLDDITPAYHYLKELPFVDANRIGILGFSMGGFDVLKVMEVPQNNPKPYQTLPFKAAASFYGVCHRLDAGTTLKGTTKLFIGEKDDRATTSDCVHLVNISQNQEVSIQIYKEALHGFDNFEFPAYKEVVDEKGEHYHIGFHESARAEALIDLPNFFDKNLKALQ